MRTSTKYLNVIVFLQFALKVPKIAKEKSSKWFGRGSKVMDESTELAVREAEHQSSTSTSSNQFIGAIYKKEGSFAQNDPESGSISVRRDSISTQALLPNLGEESGHTPMRTDLPQIWKTRPMWFKDFGGILLMTHCMLSFFILIPY